MTRQRTFARIAGQCLLALLTGACAPAKLYPGPALPADHVASIVAEAEHAGARVVEIDGGLLHRGHAELAPGTHELVVWLESEDHQGFELGAYCWITAELEAGETYRPRATFGYGGSKPVAAHYGYGHRASVHAGLVALGSGNEVAHCERLSRSRTGSN